MLIKRMLVNLGTLFKDKANEKLASKNLKEQHLLVTL